VKVQAEVSLYPLRTASLTGCIDGFVERLRQGGFNVEIGAMSSRISGRCDGLFRALGGAFEEAARRGDVVLLVKVSNACPVGSDHEVGPENEHSG
jgi:uncharacterized protein YqgV (UPF0045/DUF77 family)